MRPQASFEDRLRSLTSLAFGADGAPAAAAAAAASSAADGATAASTVPAAAAAGGAPAHGPTATVARSDPYDSDDDRATPRGAPPPARAPVESHQRSPARRTALPLHGADRNQKAPAVGAAAAAAARALRTQAQTAATQADDMATLDILGDLAAEAETAPIVIPGTPPPEATAAVAAAVPDKARSSAAATVNKAPVAKQTNRPTDKASVAAAASKDVPSTAAATAEHKPSAKAVAKAAPKTKAPVVDARARSTKGPPAEAAEETETPVEADGGNGEGDNGYAEDGDEGGATKDRPRKDGGRDGGDKKKKAKRKASPRAEKARIGRAKHHRHEATRKRRSRDSGRRDRHAHKSRGRRRVLGSDDDGKETEEEEEEEAEDTTSDSEDEQDKSYDEDDEVSATSEEEEEEAREEEDEEATSDSEQDRRAAAQDRRAERHLKKFRGLVEEADVRDSGAEDGEEAEVDEEEAAEAAAAAARLGLYKSASDRMESSLGACTVKHASAPAATNKKAAAADGDDRVAAAAAQRAWAAYFQNQTPVLHLVDASRDVAAYMPAKAAAKPAGGTPRRYWLAVDGKALKVSGNVKDAKKEAAALRAAVTPAHLACVVTWTPHRATGFNHLWVIRTTAAQWVPVTTAMWTKRLLLDAAFVETVRAANNCRRVDNAGKTFLVPYVPIAVALKMRLCTPHPPVPSTEAFERGAAPVGDNTPPAARAPVPPAAAGAAATEPAVGTGAYVRQQNWKWLEMQALNGIRKNKAVATAFVRTVRAAEAAMGIVDPGRVSTASQSLLAAVATTPAERHALARWALACSPESMARLEHEFCPKPTQAAAAAEDPNCIEF